MSLRNVRFVVLLACVPPGEMRETCTASARQQVQPGSGKDLSLLQVGSWMGQAVTQHSRKPVSKKDIEQVIHEWAEGHHPPADHVKKKVLKKVVKLIRKHAKEWSKTGKAPSVDEQIIIKEAAAEGALKGQTVTPAPRNP